MKWYCITWGEAAIQTLVFANSEVAAIIKFKRDMRDYWGEEDFDPNIKYIDVVK